MYTVDYFINKFQAIPENKKYTQPTPKQRILAALQDIKKLQAPEYQDITSSLASEFVESPESTDVIKTIVNA